MPMIGGAATRGPNDELVSFNNTHFCAFTKLVTIIAAYSPPIHKIKMAVLLSGEDCRQRTQCVV